MSFSDTAENAILEQVYRGTALPWQGNTNLWLAAHTADPGDAGTAITSEAAYGSYARALIVRSSGLVVIGNTVSNVALAQLPASTVLGSPITHLSLVTTASGAGTIIGRYTLASSIPTSVGVQPQFAANVIAFTLD